MCVKKDRIVEALKATGMEEDQAIAAQLEIGKISMVGCTTYRDETDKRLMKIMERALPRNPEEARKLAHKLCRVLEIEKTARRGSERVAMTFYRNMGSIDHYP
jgi:hypothetical protein